MMSHPFRYGAVTDHLWIKGPPGTGKSHIIQKLTQIFNDYAEQNNRKIRFIYTSARNKTVPNYFSSIVNTPLNQGPYGAITELVKVINKYQIVYFIIDELDRIRSSAYHNEPVDEIIGTFTRLHEYSTELTAHVNIIVITNKLNIHRYLTPSTASAFTPTNIFFPGYDATQLNKIILSRVKLGYTKEILNNGFKSALAKFSAQLYQSSSNLRQGMRILLKLGQMLEEQGKTKAGYSDIELARRLVEENEFQTKIITLDDNQLVFLVSLANLQTKNKNTSTSDVLKEYMKNCNQFHIEKTIKTRHLLERVVPNLESMGFFLSTVRGLGRKRGTERTFEINKEDIKDILETGTKEIVKRADG